MFTITETDDSNDFELGNVLFARLLDNPASEYMYQARHSGLSLSYNHQQAAVVAHAFLSGLRSQCDSVEAETAIAKTLAWLQQFADQIAIPSA